MATKTRAPVIPLTPEQRASRLALLDAANAEMRDAKQTALDAYFAVCPATDHRCSEAHRTANRVLIQAFADADARYSDIVRSMGS